MSKKQSKSAPTKDEKKAILDQVPGRRMTVEEWKQALDRTEPSGRMDLIHLKKRLPGEKWPWHDNEARDCRLP